MPVHWFVRDAASRVAHHLDYEVVALDHALCGHPFGAIRWEGPERPRAVCRRCEVRLDTHESRWWQREADVERARQVALEQSSAEMDERIRYLEAKLANQRKAIHELEKRLKSLNWERAGRESSARLSAKIPKSGAPTNSARQTTGITERSRSWLPKAYKSPRITVVSGGLPGHGKRR